MRLDIFDDMFDDDEPTSDLDLSAFDLEEEETEEDAENYDEIGYGHYNRARAWAGEFEHLFGVSIKRFYKNGKPFDKDTFRDWLIEQENFPAFAGTWQAVRRMFGERAATVFDLCIAPLQLDYNYEQRKTRRII